MKKNIILASGSPRRKELLSRLVGKEFQIIKTNFEENNEEKIDYLELAKKHGLGKAKDVYDHLDSELKKNSIVIGADTFVVLDGEVLGKPLEEKKAYRMLKKQLGRVIEVVTGLCVIDGSCDKIYLETVVTKVHMAKLSDRDVLEYIMSEKPLDKAGAFGIQDKGAVFVEKIEGDYFNIMGFPLYYVNQLLLKCGYEVF